MVTPLIIVIPGIAIYYLYNHNLIDTSLINITKDGATTADSNRTYPTLLLLLPKGIKGITVAAFAATVIASLAAKVNSISTIFTLDIYKKAFQPNASEAKIVNVGKLAIVVSTIIGILLTLALGNALMGEGKQGFNYIQEYTGFVSPGIFAMFLLGFFWKRTTSAAAMFAMIGGLAMSIVLKFLPMWTNLDWLTPYGFYQPNNDNGGKFEIPFLDRMGFVFLFCFVGMAIINFVQNKRGVVTKGLEVDASMFKTSKSFAIGAL